jgi:hypothetical protein
MEFEEVRILNPEELMQEAPNTEENTPEEPSKEEAPRVLSLDDTDLPDFTFGEETPKTENLFNDTSKPASTKDNVYKVFADELAEKGVLEIPEGKEIKSAEDLRELFINTVDKRVEGQFEQFKGSFSGAKKVFLELEDYFEDENKAIEVAQDIAYFKELNTESLEDETAVKNVLSKYYFSKGFTPELVKKQIEQDFTLDTQLDKAKEFLPEIQKMGEQYIAARKQQHEQNLKLQEESNKKYFNTMLSTIDSLKTMVPFSLSDKEIELMKESTQKIVFEDETTGRKFNDLGYKQYLDPHGFNAIMQFLNSRGVFSIIEDKEGNKKLTSDFSKLTKLVEKKVTSKLDTMLGDTTFENATADKVSLDLADFASLFGTR